MSTPDAPVPDVSYLALSENTFLKGHPYFKRFALLGVTGGGIIIGLATGMRVIPGWVALCFAFVALVCVAAFLALVFYKMPSATQKMQRIPFMLAEFFLGASLLTLCRMGLWFKFGL